MKSSHIFRKITLRTMLQNKTRTAVTIFGVILSVAMLTAVTTFGSSFVQFLIEFTKEQEGDWHLSVKDYPLEEAQVLAAKGEVDACAAVQNYGFAKWEKSMAGGNKWGYFQVKGLPDEGMEQIPIHLTQGRMPKDDTEILLPEFLWVNEPEGKETKIGDTIELEIGTMYLKDTPYRSTMMDEIEILYTPGDEEVRDVQKKKFTVTGFYDSGWYYGGYGFAFEVFCGPGKQGTECDLYIRLKDAQTVFLLADQIDSERYSLNLNAGLLRWLGVFENDNAKIVLNGMVILIVAIIMTGAISLIYNAFSISLRERTTQFGLLSSIGATRKQLRTALCYEAIFVSVIGIPIGILCGIIGIGITLHYISFGITEMAYGVQQKIPLYISSEILFFTVVLAVVTVGFSVFLPAVRVRRISPMEALRATRDIRISQKALKSGKEWFRFGKVPGMLARKNYKRDRRKYRSTILSLTMSIILFVSAVTIGRELEESGSFVLEAPEVELECVSYTEDFKEIEQSVWDILKSQEEIKAIHFYRDCIQYMETDEEDLTLEAMNNAMTIEEKQILLTQCVFIPDQEFEELAKKEGIELTSYWEDGAAKAFLYDTCKVYNPTSKRYEKRTLLEKELPDRCRIGALANKAETEEDEMKMVYQSNFQIHPVARLDKMPAGILNHYESNPTWILPLRVLESLPLEQHETLFHRFSIKCSDHKAVYENLESAFGEAGFSQRGELSLVNLMETYEHDHNFMVALQVLSGGFIVLISLTALANVFNTVSTNLLLRRREFAMLRSLGFSPKDGWKMLLLESFHYSIKAILYGSIGSVVVSFFTWEILRVGVDHRFVLPIRPLMVASVMVYLMVAGTMVFTMRKMNRTTICEELKMNGIG